MTTEQLRYYKYYCDMFHLPKNDIKSLRRFTLAKRKTIELLEINRDKDFTKWTR